MNIRFLSTSTTATIRTNYLLPTPVTFISAITHTFAIRTYLLPTPITPVTFISCITHTFAGINIAATATRTPAHPKAIPEAIPRVASKSGSAGLLVVVQQRPHCLALPQRLVWLWWSSVRSASPASSHRVLSASSPA